MNKFLTAEDILVIILELSKSQGFYGRLLKSLEESKHKHEILESWAKNNFKDKLDFILWIEQ